LILGKMTFYFTYTRKKLIANQQKKNGFPVPKISQSTRDLLGVHFRSEVESLGDLLGRKIPWKYK
jgi:hypothetical protein